MNHEIKKTSLYQKHLDLGASMSNFAAYSMPMRYGSVVEEVQAVRKKAGIFDVSHMGEFLVTGKDHIKFIDYLITNDYINLPINKAIYSPICNESGGILDDLIVYKVTDNKSLICVNAANKEKDWAWIKSHHKGFECELEDISEQTSLIALQGPESEKMALALGLDDNALKKLCYYGVQAFTFEGGEIICARTGYTGEDGFEFFCSHQQANSMWDSLIEQGAKACGLAARDTLRIEVAYPLYGQELSENVTPLDCALKWCVKFDKPRFIGQDFLKVYKANFQLVKLSLNNGAGIPRTGYQVLDEEENEIGLVSSGTHSPGLECGLALASIRKEVFPENKKFFIKIRNKIIEANYHPKAFVTGGHK